MSSYVAIVDYGLGNLYSVQHACGHAGMSAAVTSSKEDILAADAVILPGVGAFGDAMANLRRLDLVGPLRDIAQSRKPLVGICLGMQLIMSESFEFGRHEGLGIVRGPVVRFEQPTEGSRTLKVPQVGWNRIYPAKQGAWAGTLLEGQREGEHMYFVHSFYAKPADPAAALAVSRYGHIEFCSALRLGNVMAFQFHPERSGPAGLRVYSGLAKLISQEQ
jgi:imidazole glycerol-phosphate synthase subunit HisH